jgi:hypothetical protein
MLLSQKDFSNRDDSAMDTAQQRLAMIAQLEGALKLAEKLNEPVAAYLIERALDEARTKSFSSVPRGELQILN